MNTATKAITLAKQEILYPQSGVALAEVRRLQLGNNLEGYCLLAVRSWLGIPKRDKSAKESWIKAPHSIRHSASPSPPGVPVYWEIGKYWHIALSVGNNSVISTDIKRRGKADRVPIQLITSRWNAKYLGWTEFLNDHRVWAPPPPQVTGRYIFIKRGDTLSSILGDDWLKTWNHPKNAQLKKLRKQPELIQPGDRLWVDAYV